jgi:hypothetical protein
LLFSATLFLFLILLNKTADILSQLMPQKTGTNSNGKTMLLYRTIAPRLLTAYPMLIKMEKERKRQK